MRVSVVLPVLNEVGNLVHLVPELVGLGFVAEIIIVDDGSTDGTVALVTSMMAHDGRIRLLERREHPSLVSSLRQGFAAAKSEVVAWMDADGTMPPEDLSRLVSALTPDVAMVVGTRFGSRGRGKGQRSDGLAGRIRGFAALTAGPDSSAASFLSWVLNTAIIPSLSGVGVHDFTSGFACVRATALQQLELEGTHGEYFISLWRQALEQRLVVVEVPYSARPRHSGRSKTISGIGAWPRRAAQYGRIAWKLRKLRR